MDSRIVEIAAWSRPVDGFPADFGERRAGREPLDQVEIGDVGSSSATLPSSFFMVPLLPGLLDDCVSQGADPVFKSLCLHHHHLAVVGAERNSRHTLKGGEEMDREFS